MPEHAPMQSAAITCPTVTTTVLGGTTVARLKSWARNFRQPVSIAGKTIPSPVGETLNGGSVRVLCTGPGDWLLIFRDHAPAELRTHVLPHLADGGLVLVDLSDGPVGIEVQGAFARELLSKGCGLDFHPRRFSPGQCARTRFAQIPVVIECLDAARFELYVARSYAEYLCSWLADASTEYLQGAIEDVGKRRVL